MNDCAAITPKYPQQGDSMTKRPIIPPKYRAAAEQLKLSPALMSGNHVFLTGVTGADAGGQMPDDPASKKSREA